MKAPTFIPAILIFLLSGHFLPENTAEVIRNSDQSITTNTNTFLKIGYKYERVLKDGIWYIYVYDNGVLIDVYPE